MLIPRCGRRSANCAGRASGLFRRWMGKPANLRCRLAVIVSWYWRMRCGWLRRWRPDVGPAIALAWFRYLPVVEAGLLRRRGQRFMGKNVVVLGTQWGDEGKGKIVGLLTDQAAAVVRFQGGH